MMIFLKKKKKIGKCYMTLVAIKYFNVLISNKPFLEQLIKKQTRSVWKFCQNVKKQMTIHQEIY